MIELTQSSLAPGNCVQTCVACVLELDPGVLPDQTTYDRFHTREDGTRVRTGGSYHNAINAYLRTHHGLCYFNPSAPVSALSALFEIRAPGWHFMSGKTVRTATSGVQHLVVGRYGEMVWDPHPSRAGLIGDIAWVFLAPYPKEWVRTWDPEDACECPACGGKRARKDDEP